MTTTSSQRGYIDKTGIMVIDLSDEPYVPDGRFIGGRACVGSFGGRRGFIDKNGKLVIPCLYTDPIYDDEDE